MPTALPPLIAALLATLPDVELIETHISWVLITPPWAYKIKKPLNLGFLDFSTLTRRAHFCQEEVRLNQRLAPETYLAAVPITGSPAAPRIGGEGAVLEWAVQMRAFAPHSTLDHCTRLDASHVDAIADQLARFHAQAAPAPPASPWGSPAQVLEPVADNFRQLRALAPPPAVLARLQPLQDWSQAEGARLTPHFQARKAQGRVREGHGDLHLGNIAWVADAPLIFDCIEFNPALRFIDVINDLAFLVMDLHHRGHPALAWRTLNRYLEHTGDYPGLAALTYYLAYRALVRAKVGAIAARQHDAGWHACLDYLALAEAVTRPPRPALVLMHGVSGSGKSVRAQQLLEGLGAVRLRADVERKRLFGLPALASSAAIAGGIYTPQASARTRSTLLEQTEALLRAGLTVIVDATFIAPEWRDPFSALAVRLGVARCWVAPQADAAVLRSRVALRAAAGNDASEAGLAVLDAQLAHQTPLTPAEAAHSVCPAPDWSAVRLLDAVRDCLGEHDRGTHPPAHSAAHV